MNSQDERVQYTIETEDAQKKLPYLDVSVEKNKTGTYDFRVFGKDAITNVQIKRNSSVDPKILSRVFKGFLAKAWRICSNTETLKEELDFLVAVFVENGHDKKMLSELRDKYRPPEMRSIESSSDNNNEERKSVI